MRIFTSLEDLPEFRNPAVTLGTFDGVHIGHQQIVHRLMEAAADMKGESVLLTFWPHPRMVLQPDDPSIFLLNTLEEKQKILQGLGLENLVIIPFTIPFS